MQSIDRQQSFGGEPIVVDDVLRLMTKGPAPAARAGSLEGANKSSMLRCQMSSDAWSLTTRATPSSFPSHAPERSEYPVAPSARERRPASLYRRQLCRRFRDR